MTTEIQKLIARRDTEENDQKALGLDYMIARLQRLERFKERWWPKIAFSPLVETVYVEADRDMYTIILKTEEIIDIYPKANKLLIRKQNKWIKPATKWLISKLQLKKEEIERSKHGNLC